MPFAGTAASVLRYRTSGAASGKRAPPEKKFRELVVPSSPLSDILFIASLLTPPVAQVQFQVGTPIVTETKAAQMFKGRKTRPVPTSELEGYNSSDVARICGVSLRQLQWWDERNVVSPRQDGHKRIYMPEEVVEISVIAELRRKGFSLQKIRRVLRFLQKDMGKRLSEAIAGSAEVHLLTDGKSIYLEDAPNRIIDVMKNARQPMFLVCVTDQARRLSPPADRKPARSETNLLARKVRIGS